MERIELPTTYGSPFQRNNRIPALVFEPRKGTSGEARAGVLMIHGYGQCKEAFQLEAASLAEYAGCLVVAPDLPLHGERSVREGELFEYPYFGEVLGVQKALGAALADVRQLASFMKSRLPVSAPVGMMGFSLGGCLTILSMSRMEGVFQAGVSIVGSGFMAELILESALTTDIRDDLLAIGCDLDTLRMALEPVEATTSAAHIRNLFMIGAHDDEIVPGHLVERTFRQLDPSQNRLWMLNGCGHFPPRHLIDPQIINFLEAKLFTNQ